jgi:hypothetical protein
MEFPPEHYFQTALERMRQAQYLFADGSSYALSLYVGGVAVECLLRAFKGRRHPEFDERHHLLRLFLASGMLRVDREKLSAQQWTDARIDEHLESLRVAVNEIYRLWSNSYRFASEDRLQAHIKKITGYQKIKGNYLKEQCRRFLSSAQTFVDKGVVQWQM